MFSAEILAEGVRGVPPVWLNTENRTTQVNPGCERAATLNTESKTTLTFDTFGHYCVFFVDLYFI